MARGKKKAQTKEKVPVEGIVSGPRVNKLAVLMWLQAHDFYIPQPFVDRGVVPAVGVGGEREFKSTRKMWNDVIKLSAAYGVGNAERIIRLREVYHPHMGKGRSVKTQQELFDMDDKFLTVNGNTVLGDYIRVPSASLWYVGKKHKDSKETLWVHVKYSAESIVITRAQTE